MLLLLFSAMVGHCVHINAKVFFTHKQLLIRVMLGLGLGVRIALLSHCNYILFSACVSDFAKLFVQSFDHLFSHFMFSFFALFWISSNSLLILTLACL